MSTPNPLLQATLNRLTARLGQKLVDAAAKLAVISQETPEKLQKEWDLFQEEVIAEADRLKTESREDKGKESFKTQHSKDEQEQEKIDKLRAKIADLNKKIEAAN